jgi:uncharacterized membrane protein HdeD (DUF308 family)
MAVLAAFVGHRGGHRIGLRTTHVQPEGSNILMFKSTSTSMIVVGVLAIIAGIVALAWPGVTVLVLVILFAAYAFSAAITQGSRAFSSDGFGPVLGHLLLAVVDIAAGVAALAWPAPTVLVLVYVVGFWAILGGLAEFFTGFAAGETAGTRALFLLGGLVSIAFGVVLLARPGVGALTLALLYGLFALTYGVTQIAAGSQLRSVGRNMATVLHRAA